MLNIPDIVLQSGGLLPLHKMRESPILIITTLSIYKLSSPIYIHILFSCDYYLCYLHGIPTDDGEGSNITPVGPVGQVVETAGSAADAAAASAHRLHAN